jgi:osmotically inducible protein OsmC
MAAQRKATATWEGNLTEGKGEIVSVTSGAFTHLGVTWKARTSSSSPQTSPEELIAAAHAACYSMALSNELNKLGKPAAHLETSAVCTFELEGGAHISSIALQVKGRVPGIDPAAFTKAAEAAKVGCPVSKALKGNVEITLTAELDKVAVS